MRKLKQSTARNLMVFMAASADHVTGLAGLTLTVTGSKNGGAFGSITLTPVDRGDGWYSLPLTTGHTDTLGDLALHVTGGATADASDLLVEIVAYDPQSATNLGLSNLDVASSALATAAIQTTMNTNIGTTLAAAVAIQAKTDNLPADPSSEATVLTRAVKERSHII